MVKKSKILDRIVSRFRSGAVRVSDDAPAHPLARGSEGLGSSGRGASAARPANAARAAAGSDGGSAGHVASSSGSSSSGSSSNGGSGSWPDRSPSAGGTASAVPVRHVPETTLPDSRRKLSTKEDAALTMSSSFSELSSLLRGVQVRMEDQGGRLAEMGGHISRLPVTAEAQLEVLKALASQLEKQNAVSQSLVQTFGDLPEVMRGVKATLERSAASDQRTAQTLDEFKSTMGRIQSSMGEMVSHSKVQADATASLATEHKNTVGQLENSTQAGLKALRTAQEDQATRLTKLVGETGRLNRAVVVLLVLSLAAMVAIFVAIVSA